MLLVKQLTGSSLSRWFALKDRIDFEPRYQRKNNLWSPAVQRLFINTILNEYDFPKIYLADFSSGISELNENRKLFAVIDGKQRLSTIFDFFEDALQLDDTPVYIHDEPISLKGKRFSDLRREFPMLARRVDEYMPTIMGVITDREGDIYEMFIRLNLNVSISGPEKRNAMPGPVPGFIRRVAVHPFFKEKISYSTERGQDLSTACQFMMIEQNGTFVNIKKKDLDIYVKRGEKVPPEALELIVERVEANLNKMRSVFVHTLEKGGKFKGDPLLKSTTQLPLYYRLCKEYFEPAAPKEIRTFIEQFEKARSNERKNADYRAKGQQVIEGLHTIDEKLLRYNALIRSPDDRTSLDEMYSILRDKFRQVTGMTK